MEWLRQQGQWEEAVERLKIQREGGYAGIDALMFLLYYFGSGLRLGVKEFGVRARECRARLAAVGDRRLLPTQASMSRILGAVDLETAQDFGGWLLRQAPASATVLQHPSVLTRDATGRGWHVFDWDPTVTTLRHRALPVLEGTPDARRRSKALAAPGYSGRKRGDVQFSRGTLQHAGSGLWLGIEMGPGNGSIRESFQAALGQVVATCEQAGIARERCILRADGAAGNVPFITACIEVEVGYITRLARYQFLEDASIIAHLNSATWFDVPSSGSGPTRQAADLGRVTLEPAQGTLRADGSPFEPVEVRVVVSRFPSRTEEGRGAGVVIDGWQYELYGTDLDLAAWPEAEVVAGYYGRIGQENRFHQEDRELGLDRIFSYHLPGQYLATLAGLFVWNFNICRGMDLARPPEPLPEQPLTQATPASEPPQLPEPGPGATPHESDGLDVDPAAAIDGGGPRDTEPSTIANADPTPAQVGSGSARSDVIAAVDALEESEWAAVLENHEGWLWSAQRGGLLCPGHVLLPLANIEQVKGEPVRARFTAPGGACGKCEFRTACIRSDDPRYRKDVRLKLPESHAESLRALWQRTPTMLRRPPHTLRALTRPKDPVSAQRATRRVKHLTWQPPELGTTRPLLAVAPPTLLPAEVRKITRRMLHDSRVEVRLNVPTDRLRPSPVLAVSAAERQKRRLSWPERLRWNALPTGATIELRVLGPDSLRLLLSPTDGEARLGNAS
ncbi:MAG: hypothetical protein Q8L86_04505 [Vicinamibacterales bacterium]|nr:hypothetical protein [Vicinamibacterales bacterium]